MSMILENNNDLFNFDVDFDEDDNGNLDHVNCINNIQFTMKL